LGGLLLPSAAALVVLTIALLLFLVVRRWWLGRQERRRTEAAKRLRPAAIEFVAGDEPLPEDISAYDQTVLAAQLRSYSHSLSGEAAERIATYFRDSAAYTAAIRELRSRRAWRRADAAFALGDMAVPDGSEALLHALDDRSRIVRSAAARGLGRLRDEAATVPLVESLVATTVPRGVAGDALLHIGPKIVPQLRDLASSDDPSLQATALKVLGLVGDSGEADVAIAALQDPSAEVRAAAAEALGRIGTPASVDELRAALDDRVRVVRAAAAESLGAIGTDDAVPRLLEIARTDEFVTARAAAQAAAKLDMAAVRAAADEPDAGPHLHEVVDRAAL
jgi:HEAT repeat protein